MDEHVDVCNPPLVWVDGRCYRLNPYAAGRVRGASVSKSLTTIKSYQEEEEEEQLNEDYGGMYGSDVFVPQKTSVGYRSEVAIPSGYFGYLIGKKGETLRRLQTETTAKVYIPRMGSSDPLVITAADYRAVELCQWRICALITAARKHLRPTHFVSVPLNCEGLRNGLETFKREVLTQCNGKGWRGVEEGLFQLPAKLHLTIATFPLLDERERTVAKELMQSCYDDAINKFSPSNLEIRLRGLDYMNDDPSEVSVLYATVRFASSDDERKFQDLVDYVAKMFEHRGLATDGRDSVKLHATVMNSRFKLSADDQEEECDSSSRSRQPLQQERSTFDARQILERFKDFDFGVQKSIEFHLSQRFAYGEDGYYYCLGRYPIGH